MHEVKMEDRKKYIGGSDVGAIMGVNPWRTPLDVFFEKTGMREIEEIKNEYVYWGKKIEPLIIQKFIEKTNLSCFEEISIRYHDKYTYLAAHVDGLIGDHKQNCSAILECKTTSFFKKKEWGEEGTDKIPLYYKMQVAHYCNIYDLPKCYIAVLFGGNDFRIYEYNRDLKFEKDIENKLVDFWENHVLTMEPPILIKIEEANELYSTSTKDSFKVADNDILNDYYEMIEIQQKISALENEYDSYKLKMMNFLKDAETLIENNGNKLCRWKTQKSNRFITNEFKSVYPDIYNKYLKTSVSRRFTLLGVNNGR